MAGAKKTLFWVLVILIVGCGGIVFYFKFEGEKPSFSITPHPSAIGRQATFALEYADRRTGLKDVTIEITQEGRTISLLQETYSPGTHQVKKALEVTPLSHGLRDGEALFRARVRDRSWRGNRKVLEVPTIIDSRPPAIRTLSRFHYVNQGGAGLVVYQASEKLARTGVNVGDLWFPGYQVRDGKFLCFFAVPFNASPKTSIILVSEDVAHNVSRTAFAYRIKPKKFRNDTVRVTEEFLQEVLPYFVDRDPSLKGDLRDIFLRVNRDLRKTNTQRIDKLCRESTPQLLCSGPFLRMEGGKRMAGFADHRVYTYDGQEIDRQYHMGVDLASLAMSPVKAANRGKVVYAGELGIYGNTILMDHGCGIFSMYGHLSQIHVQPGATVEKGKPIGITGSTGLAGGDHLHFSILISGVYVNPIEWWDPHWIRDNVDIKLAHLQSPKS